MQMNLFHIFEIDFWIQILYYLPAVVIALSFHEFAHAFVAYKCGDSTAKYMGRLTLNPVKHIDPIGFVSMLLLGFGWAKPVPVNPNNYKGNKRLCDIMVSLAGVAMNLLIAIVAMFLMYFLVLVVKLDNTVIITLLYYMVVLNLGLLVFNLIPIPPLDGSHIAEDLLSPVIGEAPFIWLRRYGMFVLLAVLMMLNTTGILGIAMNGLYSLLELLFGLIFKAYV